MATGRLRQLVAGDCSCDDPTQCGCVVVDSAASTVVLSLIGPVLLIGLALFWMASGSPWWVLVMLVLGVVVLVVVLFDMPIAAVFSEAGVTRRTPLRDHTLAWAEIDKLSLTGSGRNPGVAARVGRRNYLLADRAGLDSDQLGLLARMRPSTPSP
jgi:hypothetical protein